MGKGFLTLSLCEDCNFWGNPVRAGPFQRCESPTLVNNLLTRKLTTRWRKWLCINVFYFLFVFICNQINNLKFVGLTVFFCLFFFKDVFCLSQRTSLSFWQGGSLRALHLSFSQCYHSSELALLQFLVDQFSFGCHLTLGPLVMFCPQTGALWQCFAWLKNGFFFPPSWWPSRSMGTTC